MISYAVFSCALFTLIVATTLILHPQYEDGIVGKLGLACLAIASAGQTFNFFDLLAAAPETALDYSKINLVFWTGVSLFLGHHFYNFYRFKTHIARAEVNYDATS